MTISRTEVTIQVTGLVQSMSIDPPIRQDLTGLTPRWTQSVQCGRFRVHRSHWSHWSRIEEPSREAPALTPTSWTLIAPVLHRLMTFLVEGNMEQV